MARKKKLTKWERKVRAHNAAARRRRAKAAADFYRKMNPGKKAAVLRVTPLKGGGYSVKPLKGNAAKSAFQRCVSDVEKKGGAYDPRAVCASAGRSKYGQREMTRRSLAGKKRARRRRSR
jgi:hypothetical protein